MNQDTFIIDFHKIHGSRYNYDKAVYLGSKVKIEIFCNQCQEYFWQTPSNHMTGRGHMNCAHSNLSKRLAKTSEVFITQAQQIHGDTYNYSNVNYINDRTKIEIICKNHGSYNQIPGNHLKGKGCPRCAGKNKTTQDLIAEFTEIHGNKYTYDRVNYNNVSTKVEILCNKCQRYFNQTPGSHLNGRGCSYCFIKRRRTTNEAISLFIKIHGNRYNYDKVEYINKYKKIKISCWVHGLFLQSPGSHLRGRGCPKCQHKNEALTGEYLSELIPNINIRFQESWNNIFTFTNSFKRSDFYFEYQERKIIVEYNGHQHYEPILFGNINLSEAIDKLKVQQVRDLELQNLCRQHGIHLIEVDGRKYQGKFIKVYLQECLDRILK